MGCACTAVIYTPSRYTAEARSCLCTADYAIPTRTPLEPILAAELVEMLRRFLLVGAFVVIQPGTIQQLAYATFLSLLFLAIQLTASPFRQRADDFMAATSSLALAMLFVLCLLYKYGALTQRDDVQELLSLELQNDYVVSYVTFSGVLWATCISTFAVLAAIMFQLAGEEAIHRARARRLIYRGSGEEVVVPREFLQSTKRLQQLVHGKLYRKDPPGWVVETAAPLPSAGPFHIFLSHSNSPEFGLEFKSTLPA